MKFSPPHTILNEHTQRQFLRFAAICKVLQIKPLGICWANHAGGCVCSLPHHRHLDLTGVSPSTIPALSATRRKAIIPSMKQLLAVALLTTLPLGIAAAQQPAKAVQEKSTDTGPDCPMHADHSKMNERGEMGMGFSQTATTHHFLLTSNGGVIQVQANDPKDTATRDKIRAHLKHIAHAFSQGDFDIPMFVHDKVPPGAPDMKRLSKKITYTLQEAPSGGRVEISTSDPAALSAIHKFLRFQIDEHQTHDPTVVK